ncbi:MAG: O-antigen ligase family protein [Candidatus Moranbacteria bacterium]|nr:O-antigen ligase family protein [Candidatus Moranbacteria bacterium]
MTVHLVRIFLFTLPFQFALNLTPGIDLHTSRVFSILIFLSWLASGLARRKIIVPSSRTAILLVSFIFVSACSFLWAEQEGVAIRRATFPISFLPIFFVFFAIIEEKKERSSDLLLRPFFLGAGLAGIIGIIQTILPFFLGAGPVFHFWVSSVMPPFLGASFAAAVAEYPSLLVNIGGTTMLRASAFFPDPHIFAYFMGMAFPIGVLLAFRADKLSEKYFLLTLSILVLFADLLSFSRGAYLGLVFGAAYAFFFSDFDAKKKAYVSIFLILSSVTVFFTGNPIGNRFLSAFSFEEGSNQGRIEMWMVSIGKIADQPMLGYGLGNYPLVVKPDAAFREPIYAHNLFLDIATETGIVGAALFFAALVSAFLILSKTHPILTISLIIFTGHSLVETPLYSVHIFPILLLLLAFGSVKRAL